jgi:hypothetical protein
MKKPRVENLVQLSLLGAKAFAIIREVIRIHFMLHSVSLTVHTVYSQGHGHRMKNKIFEQLRKLQIICETTFLFKTNGNWMWYH